MSSQSAHRGSIHRLLLPPAAAGRRKTRPSASPCHQQVVGIFASLSFSPFPTVAVRLQAGFWLLYGCSNMKDHLPGDGREGLEEKQSGGAPFSGEIIFINGIP